MRFEVTATVPAPDPNPELGGVPAIQTSVRWVEASKNVTTLSEALATVLQWVNDDEVEPYGHAPVTFSITAIPD